MMQNRIGLSHLNTAYRNAEMSDSYATIPDGTYKAKIVSADVKQAQNGTAYIQWVLSVAKNAEEAVTIRKTNFLTDGGFPRLKGDLSAVGINPDILDPLDRLYFVLDYLTDSIVEFEQQTRPNNNNPDRPYVNHNFLRLVKESGKDFPVFVEDQVDGFDVLSQDEADKLPWE